MHKNDFWRLPYSPSATDEASDKMTESVEKMELDKSYGLCVKSWFGIPSLHFILYAPLGRNYCIETDVIRFPSGIIVINIINLICYWQCHISIIFHNPMETIMRLDLWVWPLAFSSVRVVLKKFPLALSTRYHVLQALECNDNCMVSVKRLSGMFRNRCTLDSQRCKRNK